MAHSKRRVWLWTSQRQAATERLTDSVIWTERVKITVDRLFRTAKPVTDWSKMEFVNRMMRGIKMLLLAVCGQYLYEWTHSHSQIEWGIQTTQYNGMWGPKMWLQKLTYSFIFCMCALNRKPITLHTLIHIYYSPVMWVVSRQDTDFPTCSYRWILKC